MYSDPNDGDADKDGYSDCGDPNPEYKEDYSFLDNEIYYVYGWIPYQTASYLCVKENKIGSTVFGDGLTESDNGRFRFKWRDEGYAIYNGELALTVNSDKSITLEEYTGSESQLWEITKFDIGKYSEGELGYGYGVKVRSKILDGSNPMYLSVFEGEVYVTSNQEEYGCFNVSSLSSEWLRFGQIYMQHMNWCDYGIGRDEAEQAICEYFLNVNITYKDSKDIETGIIVNQNNEEFGKLMYAMGNIQDNGCVIIATYNAMTIKEGVYCYNFIKLITEFRINGIIDYQWLINELTIAGSYIFKQEWWDQIYIGRLGSDPFSIKYCLDSYNYGYEEIKHIDGSDFISYYLSADSTKNEISKTIIESIYVDKHIGEPIILAYNFDDFRIHTFSVKNTSGNEDSWNVYNYDVNERTAEQYNGLSSILQDDERYMVGYILS